MCIHRFLTKVFVKRSINIIPFGASLPISPIYNFVTRRGDSTNSYGRGKLTVVPSNCVWWAQKTVVHDTSQWNGKFHMDRDRHYTGTFSMKHLFMPGRLYLASIPSRSNGMYAQKHITSIYISSKILLVSLDGLIYLQKSKSGHAMNLALSRHAVPAEDQSIHVRFLLDDVARRQVILPSLRFSLLHTRMPLIYHRLYII